MIQLSHIEKTFQTEHGPICALSDVSLNINCGEIFGIIGYSGAGKSTLIRLINLLEQPTSGTISIEGKQLTDLGERQLRAERRSIGMIFQHFNLLWSRTVAENISFPLELTKMPKEQREARISELIRMVGLEGRESSYPAQLSGGQKQRVGIARALANNPKVLLCDEATSALDPKTTDSILTLLSEINRTLGLTIVLITHEMSVIRKICDRVAVLDNGRIVEEGTVATVFSHPRQKITRQFVGSLHTADAEGLALESAVPDEGTVLRLAANDEAVLQKALSALLGNTRLSVQVLGRLRQTNATAVAVRGTDDEVSAACADLRSRGISVEGGERHE